MCVDVLRESKVKRGCVELLLSEVRRRKISLDILSTVLDLNNWNGLEVNVECLHEIKRFC